MRTAAEEETMFRLVSQHDRSIRNMLRAQRVPPELADDIVAETWEAAFLRLRVGRDGEVSSGWLLTVARRRLIDHWRQESAGRRRQARLVARFETEFDLSGAAEEGGWTADALPTLRGLPARYRLALWLRYVEGWTVSDVANRLDATYSATESLLARARRQCRLVV